MTDPGPRRPPVEPEPFGPGSLLWDLGGDRRVNLLLPMPALMQAMHPVIGDALERQPVAITDPWGRRTRSVDSINLWIYGGNDAIVEGRRLIELHRPVRGRGLDARDHPALDPEVWAWVPLSAYPAYLVMCQTFGEPLDAAGQERLYEEIRNLARILGVRERHIPPTVADFWAYYDTMVSACLVDHPFVHRVLDVMRRPPPPPGLSPFGPALRPAWAALAPVLGWFWIWILRGSFPPEVRDILRLSWTARDERWFRLTGLVIRQVARVTPEPLRYAPMPRHARRLARAVAAGRPTAAWHARRLAGWQATIRSRRTASLDRDEPRP